MAESDSDDSVGTGPQLEVTEYPGNGWCSDDDFQQHCHSFTPCVFRNTESFRLKNLNPFHSNQITSSISQKLVEVSCSPTADFHGHPLSRTSAKLSFAQFLTAFQARSGEEIALVTGCDAHVYLSQCCVYSVNRHEVDVPEMEHFALNVLPPIIHRTDLQSINLWANVHASFSGLHYDANHNVLFVIQGRKTVWLFPPSATDMLQPYSAYVESPNHSHRSSQELLAALGSSTRLQGMSVELSAGHALFIPEGWWHMVDSVERTVALNYWFLSPLQKLLQQARHMSPYVLRASAHALTEQRVASSLKAFRPPRSSLNKRPFNPCSSGGDLRLTLDQEEEFAAIPSAPSPASASVSVASLATNVRPMASASLSESDCDSFQSTKRRRCFSDDDAITSDVDSDGTVLMWQQRLLPACHGAEQFEHQWLSAAREVGVGDALSLFLFCRLTLSCYAACTEPCVGGPSDRAALHTARGGVGLVSLGSFLRRQR